jgi:hypothetical protein
VTGVQGTYGLAGDGLRGMRGAASHSTIGKVGAGARAIRRGMGNCYAAAVDDIIWRAHDRGEIPLTKHEKKSSTLLAELEHLSGQDVVLRRVLRGQDRLIGKLAAMYVTINWWGETPEEIEPEEQHIIDLLNEYDASLKA